MITRAPVIILSVVNQLTVIWCWVL